MTDSELATLCALWQKRLRLQDWQVVAKFAHAHELDGGNGRGTVWYTLRRREAVIKILFEAEAEPDEAFPFDPEETLVHEVLHLFFAPLKTGRDTPEEDAEEIAVSSLARALVNLARNTPKAEN